MQPQENESQLIDFHEFFAVVRRRWISIALVTLAVVGIAFGLVYRRTPVYTSTARVEVRPLTAGGDLQGYYYDLLSNMDTEAQRVVSRDVAGLAAIELGVVGEDRELLVDDIDRLTADVSVSVPANTTYIDISCTTLDPARARACAEAFANAYVADRTTLAGDSAAAASASIEKQLEMSETRIGKLEAQLDEATGPAARTELTRQIEAVERTIETIRVRLLAVPTASPNPAILALPASQPTEPSNKDYITTGALAAIVGLALGVGLAFVRERLDERVARREILEASIGAPALAAVPHAPSWRNRNVARLVTLDAPDTVTAEAYRTARTTLMYTASREDIKVVMLTGPGEGDGKTTTAANLAVALAQAGKRTVAVSADLRKPRLHRFFGLQSSEGLTEVLQGKVSLQDAIQPSTLPNLKVLPSGSIPPNPAELLASDAMDDVLETLRSVADFVLIDTPPCLVVADALELAPKSDGILVVVDGSKTTRQAAIHLRHQLERVGGFIIGGVLNNLDPKHEAPYGRYYRARDASYRKPTRRARKEQARSATPMEPSQRDTAEWPLVDELDHAMSDHEAASPVHPITSEKEEEPPTTVSDRGQAQPDVAEWR
jgi:succinoglycan biosynthesis transport protein ExoP